VEVEKRRRYLGGDSDHSILVRGLDVALLEQNRARAALSPEDDDELEKAFLQGSGSVKSSAPVTVPKKRTREDLIRELKEKRLQGGGEAPSTKTQEEEARLLEDAKRAGKFKPIGLNPIAEGNTTKKKSKPKDGEGRKKKKQKVNEADQSRPINDKNVADGNPPNGLAHLPTSTVASVPQEGAPELDEDLEIFAGVGDYQGIDIPSDEDEETSRQKIPLPADDSIAGPALPPRGKWFDDLPSDRPLPPAPLVVKAEQKAAELPTPPKQDEGEDHLDTGQLKSLAPLESSAVPSIKDLLAMDEAAQSEGKRRKRKEKKKGGGGGEASKKDVSASVKADRDYKRYPTPDNLLIVQLTMSLHRLQSHLEKKAGSSSAKG
jgi:IK cytokine